MTNQLANNTQTESSKLKTTQQSNVFRLCKECRDRINTGNDVDSTEEFLENQAKRLHLLDPTDERSRLCGIRSVFNEYWEKFRPHSVSNDDPTALSLLKKFIN